MQTLKEKKAAIENKTISVKIELFNCIQGETSYKWNVPNYRKQPTLLDLIDVHTKQFSNNTKGNSECFKFLKERKKAFLDMNKENKIFQKVTIQTV